MSINLDMDMGQLIKGLFNKNSQASVEQPVVPQTAHKKESIYKKPVLAGVAVFLFFGAFMAGVYSPYRAEIVGKKGELVEMKDKQGQLSKMKSEVRALEQDLIATKDHYRDLLEYFGDQEDIGYLYESVSQIATQHQLVVINVKETGKANAKHGRNDTVVKENEVEIELSGRFKNYMSFKESLASEKALLDIRSENIQVVQDETNPGKISAKLKIIVYTIDKEPFRKLLAGIKDNREFAQNE